jgi:hypothetical protein
MTEHEKHTSIKNKLLHDIRSGQLAMRPKFHFTLKVLALVAVVLAFLVVSIGILNFILFSIRIAGHDTLLSFGPRGFWAFMLFFPWSLLVLDIALIVLLQWLLRKFRFGYKIPVLYLLAGLVVATTVAGFVIDRGTPLNDRLYEMRGHGLPPPLGGFYDRAHRPPPLGSGVCKCTIVAIEGNILTVEDTREGIITFTVLLPANDPRATTTNLDVGDVVFVAGDMQDGIIRAFGVRELPSGGPGFGTYQSP